MQDVICLILGGGRGTRLYPLTMKRSEPAVPIAGKYRLIDIPVSNCINSDVKRIHVLTQYLSVSLHRHIGETYEFDPFSQGYVEVWPARQTNETSDWYRGTAHAVSQNLAYLKQDDCRDILILSADQLYRMDFRDLVRSHRDNDAEITMAIKPVPRALASNLGIARFDERKRIVSMVEKPRTDEQLADLRLSPARMEGLGLAGTGREYLANMGIYLFRRQALFDLLGSDPGATDLVTDLFARRLRSDPIHSYLFNGYWSDVGSIASYLEASLALAGDNPPFDFHSPEGVIYTRVRNLPASRVRAAVASHCIISDGCTVDPGARLERCVIGVRSQIGRDAVLRDAVVIGADRYEDDRDHQANRRRGIPDVGIGEGTTIERAIVDKDCRIGRGVRIANKRNLREADGENYFIRDGIVVIPNDAIIPDGTVI